MGTQYHGHKGDATYNDEHKHRADTALEDTEEEALRIHALVVVAHGRQDEGQAPECHRCGGDALDGVPLGEDHAWVGADDEAEIEDGSHPRVAHAHEVEISSQAEEGLAWGCMHGQRLSPRGGS